jgi:ABC-type methionine transport system ATPase subunit
MSRSLTSQCGVSGVTAPLTQTMRSSSHAGTGRARCTWRIRLRSDEATSSLDNTSEAIVREALERLMVGRTTILIAHRLSTIEGADRIVVLDGGQIVQEGTHAELPTHDGVYRRLHESAHAGNAPALVA